MSNQEKYKIRLAMLIKKNCFSIKRTFLFTLITLLSVVSVDSAFANTGEELFKASCAACHSAGTQRKVGPGLAGIKSRRSEDWLLTWIRNSQEMINTGDPDAVALYKEYDNSMMQSFEQFSDDDIKSILDFVENQPETTVAPKETVKKEKVVRDEADESNYLLIWGTIFLLLLLFAVYRFTRKVTTQMEGMGMHAKPHSIKNYSLIFLYILGALVFLIYLLAEGLESNIANINGFLFGVLPYVAFAIFIVGSVYRYMKKGYKVSSLSSQFLEGKKLFWGSQPFHWGILVLFFGHLVAFMFPKAVIGLNGEPVRLIILEISSFIFGLSALLGLTLLIRRRLTSKTLLVVANKMDMLVYAILFIQIISGLGVAFFVRWGSTWFASVLTPYLRSIFSFNPDLEAISQAPFLVQLHVISAFLIIAVIPFTRFMHFLVAPVDYVWRKYQVVIWNWNRKGIRQSTRHTFGKKPRNH
jgi:nitrate reductase gamma subunit